MASTKLKQQVQRPVPQSKLLDSEREPSTVSRTATPPAPKSFSITSSGGSAAAPAVPSGGWSPFEFGAGPPMTADLYAVQFPGALPFESVVFAWHAAQRLWHSATIILARTTPTGPSLSGGAVTQETPSSPQVPSRKAQDTHVTTITPHAWPDEAAAYDYYIHFHSEDRRHDLWVDSSLLRPSDFSFHPSEPFRVVQAGPDEAHRHMDIEYLREHEENTKLKTIGSISIGEYLVDTWYFSPYPKEYQNLPVLYICQFCLSFFKHEAELCRHSVVCPFLQPPGDEIYRDVDRGIAVFEVDGSSAKTYSENLCFLSKLFLDHKTLRHPVYLFLFYVLGEIHDDGIRVVGYFSKEKYSKNNLSCIMCLPQYQRKGYGQFLVNMSYALSRREGKRGTPERPLSDLGGAAYVKYWTQTALSILLAAAHGKNHAASEDSAELSLEDIASATSIEPADLALALQTVGILRTSSNRTNYFFLPKEYDAYQTEYARETFTTSPVSQAAKLEISGLLHREGPMHQPEIETSRGSRKRRRDSDRSTATGRPDRRNKAGPPLRKGTERIGPVNLSYLRWEPYDLHMGPYEYAPTPL